MRWWLTFDKHLHEVSEDEHLLICLLIPICLSSLGEVMTYFLCPFFMELLNFLLLNFMNVLYILVISPYLIYCMQILLNKIVWILQMLKNLREISTLRLYNSNNLSNYIIYSHNHNILFFPIHTPSNHHWVPRIGVKCCKDNSVTCSIWDLWYLRLPGYSLVYIWKEAKKLSSCQ